jgi:branched-chain amino acid transport system ATP-binding protein
MTALLQVRGLSKRFGGLAAVKNLDFDVADGEIVGLIGPNGAGKSTAFNLISGALRPSAGSVLFAGHEIAGMTPSAVVNHGLARTFQSASVYAKATVGENLFRGALSRVSKSLLVQATRRSAYRQSLARLAEDVDAILEITGLAPFRDKLAGQLAYGHQKRLGVAIGLATRPRLLLLDEPAAGLNPEECADFGRLLTRLKRDHSLSLLFVEHHMALVMDVCERIVVLVQGQKIAEGTPLEVRNNPAVIESYLGAPDDADA